MGQGRAKLEGMMKKGKIEHKFTHKHNRLVESEEDEGSLLFRSMGRQ